MVKIATLHKGGMSFESKLGNHSVIVDVPELTGGSDRGPQPPHLSVASLRSCVGAFIAQYCE